MDSQPDNQGQDQIRSHRKAASLLDGWRPELNISDSRSQLGIDAQAAIHRVKRVERCGTDQTRRNLEVGVVRTDRDDGTCWRRHLVLADLDVLRDGDSLTFVEHTEPVALFDTEVLDRVLRLVPALDVRTFVHDQGAEVPRVEHDDVGGLGGHIEHHEGADQDAQTTELA